MSDTDDVILERRLTRIEGAIQSGFDGVHQRLDRLNGQVGRNTAWRIDHEREHAVEDGVEAARADLGRKFWTGLTGLFAMAGVLSGVVFNALSRWG